MTQAVVCPVCSGTGKVSESPNVNSTSASGNRRTCHGCDGKGWVEIGVSPIRYTYPYSFIDPNYPYPTTIIYN